jgi:YidC/Oxa1 family membrane protein insertase
VTHHTGTDFLTMNLQCAALQSGTGQVELTDSERRPLVQGLKDPRGDPIPPTLDCGQGVPVKIPYFAFLLVMVATTFYQQRQMQKVAPPGSTNSQQQALFKLMPLMFGIFGVSFPAGLVVYWTTSNLWQIGQQYVMLRLGHIGPEARPTEPKPARSGFVAGLLARMEQQREQARDPRPRRGAPKDGPKGPRPSQPRSGSGKSTPKKGTAKRPRPSSDGKSTPKPTKGTGDAPASGEGTAPGPPTSGDGKPGGGTQQQPGTGGSSAGSRKKRPKR